MAYHSSYTGPQIDQAVGNALNKDTSTLSNDVNHIPASSVVKSALTHDLANIVATGSTNTTGAIISSGTYFYLDGVLVRAKANIDVNATFTSGTNYEAVTAGGLNDLKSAINSLLTYYNSADKTTKTIASGAQETFGTLTVPIGRYIVFADYLTNVDLPDKFTYINVLVSPGINISSLGGYYAGPMLGGRVGSIIWMGELGGAATFTLTAVAEQYTGQSFDLTLRNFCAVKIGDL